MGIAVQDWLFEHTERRQLGDGAFIEVRAGWLAGDPSVGEGLLDALLAALSGW